MFATKQSRPWQFHHSLLLLIILIGLVICFHGLVWTYPYLHYGDETRIINNGIAMYESGNQSTSSFYTSMGNYPPYRSWEIALTRLIYNALPGEDISLSFQMLLGRMMSLFYALLTIVLLYMLGQQITRNPSIGLIIALLFAVWPGSILFGQRTISDGAGLMFFILCTWFSVRAYQKLSFKSLLAASIAAGFATVGKYNYATAFLFPALAGIYFLFNYSTRMFFILAGGSIALLILLYLIAISTISTDNDSIYFGYLNQNAHVESELRELTLQGVPPDDPRWQDIYNRFTLTITGRMERNYYYLLDFIPLYSLPLALFGAALSFFDKKRFPHPIASAVVLCFLISFLGFGYFRLVEGRQLMGVLALLFIFVAVAIVFIAQISRPVGIMLFLLLIIPSAKDAWEQNNDLAKPDTRVATVNWFLNSVPEGTHIRMEYIPYEFWPNNGYQSDKQLDVQRIYRIFEYSPSNWLAQGVHYLVADERYTDRGGYYAGHPRLEDWMSNAEIVARFEGDNYGGPDRVILRTFRPDVKVLTPFGKMAWLEGYDLMASEFSPGEKLAFTLYWQRQKHTNTDYITFIHVINVKTGEAVVTFDRPAGEGQGYTLPENPEEFVYTGAYLTSHWKEKEWVFDHFEISLPDDLESGSYSVSIGLYDFETMMRLNIPDNPDNALELFELTIN